MLAARLKKPLFRDKKCLPGSFWNSSVDILIELSIGYFAFTNQIRIAVFVIHQFDNNQLILSL